MLDNENMQSTDQFDPISSVCTSQNNYSVSNYDDFEKKVSKTDCKEMGGQDINKVNIETGADYPIK